jgi:aspartate aminotransferase
VTGPSARLAGLPRSGIRAVFERAAQIEGVAHLEIGAPDFPTPPHIVEAAARAAADGFTRYTSAAGLPSLRALIADKAQTRNGIACTPEHVVVGAGGCCVLYAALFALLDPGDGVLIPDPGWANYPPMVESLGAQVQRYPLVPGQRFDPDLDALEAALTDRTRVLVVNSPGNPTGAVHGTPTLEAILDIAARHDVWVLSDEAYEDIVFEGGHVSPASLGDYERALSVFTFSKSYAMTGWRVGYAVAPPQIARAIAQVQEPLVACASSISQKAAEAALTGPQDVIGEMRESYRRRRDAATALLDREGIAYVRPRGGFSLMVGLPGPGLDSDAFARTALEDARVAVVPGSAFGPGGEGMVRAALCVSDETLELGLTRLASAVTGVAA